jgi:hypothetical protein
MPSRPKPASRIRWVELLAVVLFSIILVLALEYAACEACVIEPISKYWH